MDLRRICALVILQAVFFLSCGDTDENFVIPPLPPTPTMDSMPAWSPESDWIAFQHVGKDTDWQHVICTVRPDGSERRVIVNGVQPSWSPTSDRIAYSYGSSACVYDLAGDTTWVLPGGSWLYEPDWSPDGSKIAWSWMGGPSEIRITDMQTLECRPIGQACLPEWSPDGSEILFLDGGLCVMDSSGTDRRQVAICDSSSGCLVPDEAEWCPKGNTILFSSFYYRLWLVNVDGTGLKSLGRGVRASWSPDGEQIVFADHVVEGDESRVRLWIMNADGTGRRQLTFPDTTGARAVRRLREQ